MNPMITVLSALTALSAVTLALDPASLVTSATLGPSLILASGSGVGGLAVLAGGAVFLKALALAATSGVIRTKRSAQEHDDQDSAFAFISQTEPAQCYRRLICDLASGAMPESESQVILNLFNTETPATSHKFDFAVAANLGKQLRNAEACEVRYSCPLTGQQIDKLFN